MLEFKSVTEFKPGLISSILHKCYADLLESASECWAKESKKWDEFDRDVFCNEKVAKCTFIMCLSGRTIGFGSYDPREGPDYGIIGHNCIMPEFQGNGYGKKQVFEILKRFRKLRFKKAKVSTSEHPFFAPAQKMYKACGFREIRRRKAGPDKGFKVIDFELDL